LILLLFIQTFPLHPKKAGLPVNFTIDIASQTDNKYKPAKYFTGFFITVANPNFTIRPAGEGLVIFEASVENKGRKGLPFHIVALIFTRNRDILENGNETDCLCVFLRRKPRWNRKTFQYQL
jgi:hypothetical protein